jgi:two-component system sensor histidine kinase/response regulator
VTAGVDESLRARIGALTVLAESPLLQSPELLGDFHREAQGFRRAYGSDVLLADTQGRMLLHTGRPFGLPLPPAPPGRSWRGF